jgi:hypothetical protein
MKTTDVETNEIIELWKKLDIQRCEMEFSCGGDSMNETDFTFYDSQDKQVDADELESYFENEVYNQVEFYEVSDGHYMGEFGQVVITLEDEDDEPFFQYDKQSQSEWEEREIEVMKYDLTDSEVKFLTEKVDSIVGGEDGQAINYKTDCVLSDEEEELSEKLLQDIADAANEYDFQDADGEPQDWFTFSTDTGDGEIEIIDNKLSVEVQRSFYQLKDE